MPARRLRTTSLLVLLIALAAPALVVIAQAPGDPGHACREGYEQYAAPDGNPFTSLDACVQYAAQGHGLVPADPGPDLDSNACALLASPYGGSPPDITILWGSGGDDHFVQDPDVAELFCGFGGDDRASLGSGDVFIGGAGNDTTGDQAAGTFFGNEGADSASIVQANAVFHGGPGNDVVTSAVYGTFTGGSGQDYAFVVSGGVFAGGDDDDLVEELFNQATFDGGPGNDAVTRMFDASFNGDEGDDHIAYMENDRFNGGPGDDWVGTLASGTFNQD